MNRVPGAFTPAREAAGLFPDGQNPLQTLIWPDAGACSEPELFWRTSGGARIDPNRQRLVLPAGARASGDCWFTLFNLGKWQRECGLNSLILRLEGQGRVTVTVCAEPEDGRTRPVTRQTVSLSPGAPAVIRLDHVLGKADELALLHAGLEAQTGACLTGLSWCTADPPRRMPRLAVAVTAFRRDDAVARTVRRFCAFRGSSPLGRFLELLIVDNGQTLTLPEREGVTVLPNRNLGGAGGFSRGLIEARLSGASHCLFMDDDAVSHMGCLERTWSFLAYASDPRTAVAGAMIADHCRWRLWENGAVFRRRCHPLHMGTDLRDKADMTRMEQAASAPVPDNFYGGWWYFAFPVAQARHLAYPFFVRGDDVGFSLANRFNTVTLNGVVSVQESFTAKQSPATWYLDLRSHMAHHLSLPALEAGRWQVLGIAAGFLLRALVRMHYGTAAAVNLALEDVLRGPEFFDAHADMAARRGVLAELSEQESWRSLPGGAALPALRGRPPGNRARLLMKLTLNGLLLPGFGRFGRRITLAAEHRGKTGFCWGAAQVVQLNRNGTRACTVRHSKRQALRCAARFLTNAVRFLWRYRRLLQAYQDTYAGMTSETYWRRKLGLPGIGE